MVPPSLEYYSFLLAANNCLHDTTSDDAMDLFLSYSLCPSLITLDNND